MFNRFTGDARRVVRCAEREARSLGSSSIEAEHLLLALTWTNDVTMAAAGLDRETVIGALEAERERSLMAVGIAAGDFDVPSRRIEGRPAIAASARIALERALRRPPPARTAASSPATSSSASSRPRPAPCHARSRRWASTARSSGSAPPHTSASGSDQPTDC